MDQYFTHNKYDLGSLRTSDFTLKLRGYLHHKGGDIHHLHGNS